MPNDLLPYLNYGVLGLLLYGLLTNRVALPREVKRAEDRANKAEGELAVYRSKVEDQIIPLLTRSVDLVDAAERRRVGR